MLQSYWPVAQTTHCCWSAEWRNSTVHHAGCKSFYLLYRARKDRSITHTEAVATHQCLSWLLANCLRLLASTECASVCRGRPPWFSQVCPASHSACFPVLALPPLILLPNCPFRLPRFTLPFSAPTARALSAPIVCSFFLPDKFKVQVVKEKLQTNKDNYVQYNKQITVIFTYLMFLKIYFTVIYYCMYIFII